MSYFQEKMSVLNCLCVMWSWTVLSVLFLLGTVFLRTVFLAYMCLTCPCLFKTQRWMSFYYNFYYFRSFSSEYTTCKHVGLFWCFFIFIFYQICMCVCVCVKYKNGILFFFSFQNVLTEIFQSPGKYQTSNHTNMIFVSDLLSQKQITRDKNHAFIA